MTDEERLAWVYGNLAASTNHKPDRNVFEKLAIDKFGWTSEKFESWAKDYEWWVR